MDLLRKKEVGDSAPAPKKKGRGKKIVSLCLAAALLCGAGVGVKLLFFTEEEKAALTETTTYGTLATTIEGTGTTLPCDSFSVTAASTDAKVTGVYVSAGDTVAVGDLLYTQDDSELDELLDEYQEQIDTQNDQVESLKEQIEELQETIAQLTVTAPFSGRVTEVSAEAGDAVQKGSRLFTLVDDSQMTLTEYFSYTYEPEIYVGMAAGVSIPSLMGTFNGTVTAIEKVERITTEGTKCFAVTITLDNPGALTEGMSGAAWLTADSGEKIYPAVEGTLEYLRSKTVTAGASGTLLSVQTMEYAKVTAGQVLMTIDGSDYAKDLESAQKKLVQAQEKVVQLQERMAETEESRSDYNVVSEISGKVISVGVREGEVPRNGMTAVTVYNLDNMQITANIDELDIDQIEMGMEVRIVKTGTKGSTFTGTVTEISYEATNSNGVAYFPITITIPAGGELSAGVNVSYYINIGDAQEGVLAPLNALKSTTEGTCLFVKSDTRPENAVDLEEGVVPDGFYAVPVEVGSTNSQYARILSGVEQDVEVFTRYQNAAPSNGDTTSKAGEEEEQAMPEGGFDPSQMGGNRGSGGNFGGGSGMPNMGARP